MKQLVQPLSGGKGPIVLEVPRPSIAATEVLVRTVVSLVSTGTERSAARLAQASLLAKGRARPDLVRKVVQQARTAGVVQTGRILRNRLGGVLAMGYSAAGIAVEVGEAVDGIAPGDLVATGGAGKANHAEYQAVPGLLCSVVPRGVPASDAAFATLASVGLHALRLAAIETGSRVVVVGLGLVGQLTARLAMAAGCSVAGIDLSGYEVERARAAGIHAMVESGGDTTASILGWSPGGADAVVITASGTSSEAVGRAPALCAERASVVVVGDVGLQLDRRSFYEKELALRVARSYGPGRYERSYEEWGVDYPASHVRWTEGRNQDAVLDLLSSGRLQVSDLVTHRFPIDQAPRAYALMEARNVPFLGIELDYPGEHRGPESPVVLRRAGAGRLGVGLVGAGSFAGEVLLPAFRAAGFNRFVAVSSASGLSARRMADRFGFEKAVPGAEAVIGDDDVDVVVVATPHAAHAALVVQALEAGKAVFCEKPLALSLEELEGVEQAWRRSGRNLMVGFNRRWSSAVQTVAKELMAGAGPLVVTYRVNAGAVPPSHWYHDRRQGGRLLGEVCHFVDTCSALVDSIPAEARALSSGIGERALDQDLVLVLRYPGGSLATISYASGGDPSMEKERIDIVGRGHSVTIADFRAVVSDGRKMSLRVRDKGHKAEIKAFREALGAGTDLATSALATSRVTLAAAAWLGRGEDSDESES